MKFRRNHWLSLIDANESLDKVNRAQTEQVETIEKLCSQLVVGRLPAPEPDVFSGDPL